MTRLLACTGCGGELEWSPGRHAAVCSHCETAAELDAPDSKAVQRHPVTRSALKQEHAYGLATEAVQCGGCGATVDMEPHVALSQCAFCGSDQLREFDEEDPTRPDGIIPLRITRDSLDRRLREWAEEAPSTPAGVAEGIELDEPQGIYLPAWIFRAHGLSDWEARVEAPDGRNNTHIEDRADRHEREFIDRLLFASSFGDGLADVFFDTRELVPFDPRYLAGFPAERAQRPVDDAWTDCGRQFAEEFEEDCRMEAESGDVIKVVELTAEPRWSDETYFLALVPMWFVTYRYGGQVHRAAVNGWTGECTGELPADPRKAWLYSKIGEPGSPERRKRMGIYFFVGVFLVFWFTVLILILTNEG